MNLILHLGEAKTGTTSIQHALIANKDVLLKAGILCQLKSVTDHFNMIYALGGTTRTSKDPVELTAGALMLFDEIKTAALKNNVQQVLLSGESLFDLRRDQQELLLSRLGLNFDKIKELFYIRNPADMYFSFAQQQLKADHHYRHPASWKRDLLPQLILWEQFVGRENIFVRPFDRAFFPEGNIVFDFFKTLEKITGVVIPGIVFPEKESNVSLGAEQMILLQRYRRDFLAASAGYFHPRSNRLLRFFEQMNTVRVIPVTRARLKSDLRPVLLKNNAKFLVGIDGVFGSVLCDAFLDGTEMLDPVMPQATYSDIADIIESYSEKYLADWTQCIPEYSPLRKGSFAWSQMMIRYYSAVLRGKVKARLFV